MQSEKLKQELELKEQGHRELRECLLRFNRQLICYGKFLEFSFLLSRAKGEATRTRLESLTPSAGSRGRVALFLQP